MQLRTLVNLLGTTISSAVTYGSLELTRSKARTELTAEEEKKIKLGFIKNRAKLVGETFLTSPCALLGNRTPNQMIKDGELDLVVEVVKKLDA